MCVCVCVCVCVRVRARARACLCFFMGGIALLEWQLGYGLGSLWLDSKRGKTFLSSSEHLDRL
jgi:hypothetical protein